MPINGKKSLCVVVVLTGLYLMFAFSGRSDAGGTRTADNASVYLVRFGLDGAADIDWSGSLSADGAALSGWQFAAGDKLDGNSWKCVTREETYWDTPYERRLQSTAREDRVTSKGLLVRFENTRKRHVQITTRQGNFAFETDLAIGDARRIFLNGKASVTAVPATSPLVTTPAAEDFPSLLEAQDGALWLAYQAYTTGKGDQIFVTRRSKDVWSQPEPLAEAGGDYFRTAIAQDGSGKVWVVWAARVESNFDLYARAYDGSRWSAVERVTSAKNPDIFHALVSDAKGRLYLAYQSARSGNFDIYMRVYDGRKWSPELQLSNDPADDWEPALAVSPSGAVTVVWDTYSKGNYDLQARTYRNGSLGPITTLTSSGAFEARASAAYDRRGRLWISWDEGDWNWGKDYGLAIPESGRGLLVRRQTRIAVLENERLMQPAQSIVDAVPEVSQQVFHGSKLVLDADGNPWVFMHTRQNLPFERKGPSTHDSDQPFRAFWRLAVTHWRDGRWAPLTEFQDGYGRIDAPFAAILQRNGILALAWSSEERLWPNGRPRSQDLRFAALHSAPASDIALVPFVPSAENVPPSHAQEANDVARVRAFRTQAGGRTLRIVRGDLHRHTDVSWDGNRDGSLDDSYRYAMDAAGFDFLGVCDHQGGESIPYNWWRIQKAVDLYTIEDRFAPVYSYERSLPWPNGHRNVFFARRGREIFEMSDDELKGKEGAGKLYAYLRQFGGISSPHTSASGGGTDWRDSNVELEPVVEVYQGYRFNSEAPDGPRAWDAREAKRYAAGFVSNAWAKGIKIGVQSSSDHVSTHISYAGLYVDGVNREALIAAMKAHRSYAATDNMFVETSMGDHFMGDAFKSPAVPPLVVYVSGTAPIARLEVIRNNKIVYTHPGGQAEARFTYTDKDATAGESFYYVRAIQANGQVCWSSPIWVERQ
jgi:hypothetical protein